jgi:hypothetical protein
MQLLFKRTESQSIASLPDGEVRFLKTILNSQDNSLNRLFVGDPNNKPVLFGSNEFQKSQSFDAYLYTQVYGIDNFATILFVCQRELVITNIKAFLPDNYGIRLNVYITNDPLTVSQNNLVFSNQLSLGLNNFTNLDKKMIENDFFILELEDLNGFTNIGDDVFVQINGCHIL